MTESMFKLGQTYKSLRNYGYAEEGICKRHHPNYQPIKVEFQIPDDGSETA